MKKKNNKNPGQWPGFLLFFGFGFFQRKGSRIGEHRAGEGGHAPIDGKPLGGKPLFVFGHHIKQRQLVQIKGDLAQLQTEIGKLIEGELKQLLIFMWMLPPGQRNWA